MTWLQPSNQESGPGLLASGRALSAALRGSPVCDRVHLSALHTVGAQETLA